MLLPLLCLTQIISIIQRHITDRNIDFHTVLRYDISFIDTFISTCKYYNWVTTDVIQTCTGNGLLVAEISVVRVLRE